MRSLSTCVSEKPSTFFNRFDAESGPQEDICGIDFLARKKADVNLYMPNRVNNKLKICIRLDERRGRVDSEGGPDQCAGVEDADAGGASETAAAAATEGAASKWGAGGAVGVVIISTESRGEAG